MRRHDQQVNYHERYQEQAARRGISLSAYLVEAVSVKEQIEQL
jgi:hypothetical protein